MLVQTSRHQTIARGSAEKVAKDTDILLRQQLEAAVQALDAAATREQALTQLEILIALLQAAR